MDLTEWFAQAKYQDFVLVDQTVFVLPPGFRLELTPVETANIVTMASGRRRRDLVRRSTKFKFTWAKAMHAWVVGLTALYEASLGATSLRLYTKKPSPATVADYDVSFVDLVEPIKFKPMFRGRGLFVYEDVTLELA